ncbi:MAG: type II toxin-antitoxin system PemK/MazF family toxin [Gemmatimonadales bacterium]
MSRGPRRGEVWLIAPGTTVGREIQKPRPGLVVSPDALNGGLETVLVAPMTTGHHPYPFRVPCRFRGKNGHVVLDQLRAVDRSRLVKRLGVLTPGTVSRGLALLREMFEE